MRLLLDTHIALWAVTNDARLPAKAHSLISLQTNEVAVSTVSLWEITIKHTRSQGRIQDMLVSGSDALKYFRGAGFQNLPILPAHVLEIANLPPLHKDPFDRLLVAQASIETYRLVTSDRQLKAYGDVVVVV